jgi:transcriptional antiterminator NusG
MSDTPEEMVSNDAAPAQVDEQVDGSTEPAAELLEVPEIEEPSTIDALGTDATEDVVVPVEEEEPVMAPAEDAASDVSVEAPAEDIGVAPVDEALEAAIVPVEGQEAEARASEDEPEPAPEELEAPEADVAAAVAEAPVAEAPEPIAEAQVEEAPEPSAVAEPQPVAEEEPAPAANDPFRGSGDWYVVHTYAGYENKVKANLESRIHTMQMEDKIFNVHIPMEDVMEIKGGKKQVVQRKVFPGYLLVKMEYDNDSWYVVRNTPGVTGFVAAGTGSKPTPLSRREVEKILAVKKEEVKPQFRLGFEEGDVVRIISGPFADFNGTISEINVDQSKLKVLVNIFDRETPVELGFDQVAKV